MNNTYDTRTRGITYKTFENAIKRMREMEVPNLVYISSGKHYEQEKKLCNEFGIDCIKDDTIPNDISGIFIDKNKFLGN